MELTVEIALLLGCVFPLLRLNLDSSFTASFPDLLIGLHMFLVASAVIVGSVVIWAPDLLRPITVVCVIASAALWYRSRVGYGVSEMLPPGSLSLSKTFQAIAEPGFFQETAKRLGPVFKFSQFHRPAICVLGLKRGGDLLKMHANELRTAPLPFNQMIPGGFIRYMEPDTHRNYSRALRNAFDQAVIVSCRSVFRRMVRTEVDRMVDLGVGEGVDPATGLKRMSSVCLAHALFGLSDDDPHFETLLARSDALGTEVMTKPNAPRNKQAFDDLESAIERRLQALKEKFGGVILEERKCVLEYFSSDDAAHLESTTVLKNLLFLFLIGISNTTGLLRWVMQDLGEHPQWVSLVAMHLDNGDEAAVKDISTRVVRETLRLHQSEYIYRTVSDSFRFENYQFPRGWLVRVAVRESHRDPDVFPQPERFDPDRFEQHSFGRREFSPFGLDHHVCVGATMASTVAELLVEELARNGPWRVINDASPKRRRRHWQHWEPSSSLRIAWE